MTPRIPLPRNLMLSPFEGLSYSVSYPLVSNMYLIPVSKNLMQVDVCILLGDGVHSFTCKFKGYLQQFL